MGIEIVALIITVVGSTTAAVWKICSKLSDIEKALLTHTIEESAKHQALEGRVIKLERRRK